MKTNIVMKSFSLDDISTYNPVKIFDSIFSDLINVKSEPSLLTEKNNLVKMYEWESYSKLSCENEHQLPVKNERRELKSDTSGSIQSISDHWIDIVKHMNEESLIENQVVPEGEFYESSPEKRDTTFDTTTDEKSDWMGKVSDESFMRMEQYVRTPEVKKIHDRQHISTDSEQNTYYDAKTCIKESLSLELQHHPPITNSKFEFKPVIKVEDIDSTTSERYASAYSDYNISSKCSLERLTVSTDTLHADEQISNNDTLDNIGSSDCKNNDLHLLDLSQSLDESVKFNDTLEEMEHLIKYGMDYMLSKPENKLNKNIKTEVNDTTKCLTPTSSRFTPTKTVFNTNMNSIKSSPLKTNSKPLNTYSPFKLPQKPNPAGKNIFFKTPPTVKGHKLTPSKYENIISPVQYYIKNSPTVPIIKNVSPGKNLWEKQYQMSVAKKDSVVISKGKENTPLQQRAYKASKSVKLIESLPTQRLPRNIKVGIMAENIPKPTVIKHERREKIEKHSSVRSTAHNSRGVEDSFAHLSIATGDVSLHIGKDAIRTRTLK